MSNVPYRYTKNNNNKINDKIVILNDCRCDDAQEFSSGLSVLELGLPLWSKKFCCSTTLL